MSQNPLKPKRIKKVSNTQIACIILILFFTGVGIILFLKSKPPSVRYVSTFKPFVVPSADVEEPIAIEPEIKEEDLIRLTQPGSSDPI